ncbi:MAG TPA: response regulator transcription factor [Nocardioidaceae bacterium]|nr:response regulator transcription factor [Nocardioidaceae bacterium]
MLSPRRDIQVVTAHTADSWVRHAVVNKRVDVLLMHVDPPGTILHTELAELMAASPGLGVVAMSESRDQGLLRDAVRAGVRGWVEPTTALEHLVRVLHGVARGETWFPPALMSSVLDALLHEEALEDDSALCALSMREREVLACLVGGLSRQEIAVKLSISPHTIRTHINNLLRKLDVHTTLAAVSIARQAGLGAPVGMGDGRRTAEQTSA